MQDQGKRLLIAVELMLGVLLLWQKLFPPADQPKDGAAAAAMARRARRSSCSTDARSSRRRRSDSRSTAPAAPGTTIVLDVSEVHRDVLEHRRHAQRLAPRGPALRQRRDARRAGPGAGRGSSRRLHEGLDVPAAEARDVGRHAGLRSSGRLQAVDRRARRHEDVRRRARGVRRAAHGHRPAEARGGQGSARVARASRRSSSRTRRPDSSGSSRIQPRVWNSRRRCATARSSRPTSKTSSSTRGSRPTSSGRASSIRSCSSGSRRSRSSTAAQSRSTRMPTTPGSSRPIWSSSRRCSRRATRRCTREIVAYLGPEEPRSAARCRRRGRIPDRLQPDDRPRLVRLHQQAAALVAHPAPRRLR